MQVGTVELWLDLYSRKSWFKFGWLALTDLWLLPLHSNKAINSADVLLYNSDPKGLFNTKIAPLWI